MPTVPNRHARNVSAWKPPACFLIAEKNKRKRIVSPIVPNHIANKKIIDIPINFFNKYLDGIKIDCLVFLLNSSIDI